MRGIIAREGFPFILVSLVCTAIIWYTGLVWLTAIMVALTVFVIAFFRDPNRDIPNDEKAIVSPADGKVIRIDKVNDGRLIEGEALKISIFMNVFNVHVNRVPATGRVERVLYNPGKFFNASLDKASLENEQNAVTVRTPNGKRIVFNQIAGLIARRIVCYAKEGDELIKGERFGLIRFGSRLDVYLPPETRVAVKLGDKVAAGSSVLAYWG